jgi:hypothetical protein
VLGEQGAAERAGAGPVRKKARGLPPSSMNDPPCPPFTRHGASISPRSTATALPPLGLATRRQPVGEHGEQERSCRRPQQLHAVKQSYAEAFAREFRARPRSVSRPQDTGPGRAIQADASGRLGLEQEQRDIHMAVEASLMSASKHLVQADEDLAARNMSIYGNPFGPREVDPLEMQVSRRGTVGPSMRTAPLPPHAAPHACSRGAESGGFYS